MIICPFCHYNNEDGALFCEQCKSDLGGVESSPVIPVAEVLEIAAVEEIATPFVFADEMPLAEAMPEIPPAMPMPEEMPEIPPAMPIVEAMPEIIPEIVEALLEIPPAMPEPIAVVQENPVPPSVAVAGADDPYFIPDGSNPRLYVMRGQKPKAEYPIIDGLNFLGRADDKPVDIDLEEQENPERVWASRQHAVIELENNKLTIEDLNSSNGTFLNRGKIYPGQKLPLKANDMVQIGSIQMKVMV